MDKQINKILDNPALNKELSSDSEDALD